MHWKIWIFSGCLVPVLLSLSIWQWQRAEEKFTIRQQIAAEGVAELNISVPQQPERYSKVRIKGKYQPEKNWILDNQIYNGRFGYRVFTLFCGEVKSQCILVERGWIEGSLDRNALPLIPGNENSAGVDDLNPAADLKIQGQVDLPSVNRLIDENEVFKDWPRRVQKIDIRQIASEGAVELAPWLLRLDGAQPGSLEKYWRPIVMSPEKHRGYAVQWLLLALVLFGLTLWATRKRHLE